MSEKDRAAGGSVVAGIDIGGTFTDLILVDGRDGKVRVAKTPTTVDNQAHGVMSALAATGFPVEEIDLIVHGTTTTTNAVLERRLARTGMITTRGFRDIIELGRRTRPQPYGMTGVFVPVIPRNLRLEVSERVEASGAVRDAARRERGSRRPSAAWSRRAANRWSSISCIPTPTRRMNAARPKSPPRPGRTATSPWAMRCCRRRASSSAA